MTESQIRATVKRIAKLQERLQLDYRGMTAAERRQRRKKLNFELSYNKNRLQRILQARKEN